MFQVFYILHSFQVNVPEVLGFIFPFKLSMMWNKVTVETEIFSEWDRFMFTNWGTVTG